MTIFTGSFIEKMLEAAKDGPQKAYIQAWLDAGQNGHAAGKALGCDPSLIHQAVRRVRSRLAQQGLAPEFDLVHEIPEGMRNRGQSIKRRPDGSEIERWDKSAIAGRDVDDPTVAKLPDPKKIVQLSTNYDAQGNVAQQWVRERPEDAVREKLWREFAKQLSEDLPRVEPTTGPALVNTNLLNVVPVSDGHIGMLAWDKENPEGKDWDLRIGESMHMQSFDYLFRAAPDAEEALIAVLGDWFHYDSWKPVTPEHQNLLDADSRAPKMIRVGVRIIRYAITRALQKHKTVHVIFEIGNHDPYSALWMMESFAAIYENEPRVRINTSPQHFHYLRFGNVLIGTHHGHGVKSDKLPLIMASARPEDWGATKHRVWHCGHVHHDDIESFNGCKVEKHQILGPADSYAAQHGYIAGRSMKTIVYHREHGEVVRLTVNPEMLKV